MYRPGARPPPASRTIGATPAQHQRRTSISAPSPARQLPHQHQGQLVRSRRCFHLRGCPRAPAARVRAGRATGKTLMAGLSYATSQGLHGLWIGGLQRGAFDVAVRDFGPLNPHLSWQIRSLREQKSQNASRGSFHR
eukprot:7550232-Alexandrium_andersonii.AAC.1